MNFSMNPAQGACYHWALAAPSPKTRHGFNSDLVHTENYSFWHVLSWIPCYSKSIRVNRNPLISAVQTFIHQHSEEMQWKTCHENSRCQPLKGLTQFRRIKSWACIHKYNNNITDELLKYTNTENQERTWWGNYINKPIHASRRSAHRTHKKPD